MKTNISIIKVAILTAMIAAVPAITAAQTQLGGNIYLMSRLINFSRGQAVGIDFCNVDRVARDIRMYLVDANGNVLQSANKRVAPGQTVGIWFEFSQLPRTSSMRVGVRGVVVLAQPPDPDAQPPDPDLSLANMEVYDVLTGRTSFGLLLPAIRNPNVYFPTDQ